MVILEASPDMLVCMPNLTQEWAGICQALGVDSIDLCKVLVIFYRNTLTEDFHSANYQAARADDRRKASQDQTYRFEGF